MDFVASEELWAEQLSTCSLVVQLPYKDEDAILSLNEIGRLLSKGGEPLVEGRFMASLLVGLNYISSAENRDGSMWPQLMAGLNNLSNTEPNRDLISKLHRKALAKFWLQRFEHPLSRIGELQIHAGIPIKSQEAFIRLLMKGYRTEPEFDAVVFNEQVRAFPRSVIHGKGLDAPTWHFINQAGAVADDFVAKCIEVLDDLKDGTYDQQGGIGLPPRIIEEIIRVVAEQGSISRASGSRASSPRVVWSAEDRDQIGVELPYMPEHEESDTVWLIEFSGKQESQTIRRTLPGLEPTKPLLPLREVTPNVTLKASVFKTSGVEAEVRRWNLSLFQEDVPVLIFDANGSLNQQKGPLDPSTFRILLPKSKDGVASRIELDGAEATRRIACPFGWGKSAQGGAWEAYEVDLTGIDTLKVFVGKKVIVDGAEIPALARPVSIARKPTIGRTFLAEGVFDRENGVIHSALPEIAVPNNGNPIWQLELRGHDNRVVHSEEIIAVDQRLQPKTPVIDGKFLMQVSQGLGSTLRLPITLVPGLRSVLESKTRALLEDGSGLEEAQVRIERFDLHEVVNLGCDQRSKKVSIPSICELDLLVRPDYERFELLNEKSLKASEWINPTKSHLEDLPKLQLFVKIGNAASAKLVAIWPDSSFVELKPSESLSRLRYNLGELASTADFKETAFELILATQDGRKLKAGNSFPKKMFSDFDFDSTDGLLQIDFPGGRVPEDLEICFYAIQAPWLKPLIRPVVSNKISLPADLLGFGDVAFTVALSNPWVSSNFNETHDKKNPNSGSISLPAADPELTPDHALAYWFRTGELHENAKNISTVRAWECVVLERMKGASSADRFSVKDVAVSVLSADSEKSLAAYPNDLSNDAGSGNDRDYLKHLFVTTLLSEPAVDTERGVQEFPSRPFLACVLTSEANPDTMSKLEQLAINFWGLQLTMRPGTTERDADLASALLSKSRLFDVAPPLFLMPEEGLRETLARFLPGAILEPGTMAKILESLALDLDPSANYPEVREVESALSDCRLLQDSVGVAFTELASTRAGATARDREEVKKMGLKIRTLDLPAASIRLAALARLSARGNMVAKGLWDKHKGVLQKISIAFPDLVELDLTIAELYLKLRERSAE